MIRKIYLDMDGVLSDFDKRFIELHGFHPRQVQFSHKSSLWGNFVSQRNFTTLHLFPRGLELYEFVRSLNIPVEILSSSGGETFFDEIAEQKKEWLRKHDIHIPVNIVPGKKHKKAFAEKGHLLIDDTEANTIDFAAAGGLSILHKSYEKTVDEIKSLIGG